MFLLEDLLVVIVLYNEKIIDAPPLKSFFEHTSEKRNLFAYIYDNSAFPDDESGKYSDIEYVHDASNPGVSLAYNKAADFAKKTGKKWLLLFDQDTVLPLDFFSLLKSEVDCNSPSKLYAMYLRKGNSVISPSGYKYKRGYILKNIRSGKNSIENITFLNSGLLLSTDLFFQAGGFDIKVPLYFSDFIFINRLRPFINNYTLLPIELVHNLASNDMSDSAAFKVRYDFYLNGVKQAIESEKTGSFYYHTTAFLRALKLSFSLKDFFYIKIYLDRFLRKRLM